MRKVWLFTFRAFGELTFALFKLKMLAEIEQGKKEKNRPKTLWSFT